jgi:hypothetical protein
VSPADGPPSVQKRWLSVPLRALLLSAELQEVAPEIAFAVDFNGAHIDTRRRIVQTKRPPIDDRSEGTDSDFGRACRPPR